MNSTTTIESTIQVGWPLPYWLIIVLSGLALGLAVWIYWSERGSCPRWLRSVMAAIRFTLLMLVLWMLTGWSWQRSRTEPPELVIAVDISDSMSTTDTVAGGVSKSTRLQQAKQLMTLDNDQLNLLQQRYHVRLYTIADDALAASAESRITQADLEKLFDAHAWDLNRSVSRLGDSLTRVIERQAGRGTAAIVLLSDGITTNGTTLVDSGQRARRAAIPVHTVTIGRQLAQPDLRLTDLLSEREVYFGDRVTISASIIASDVSSATTKIELIDVTSGRILDQQTLLVDSKENQKSVSLGFVPERAGEMKLKVAVEQLPDEAHLANNHAELSLNVQNRTIKVLMVFGGPSYEFRFLKHFLERSKEVGPSKSATFELKSVLQDGDLDYILQDSSAQRFVPTDTEALAEFDVFVFGQFDPSTIPRSASQAIVRAITHGGAGCVFVSSEASLLQRLANSPLGSLLPADSASKFQPHGWFEFASTKLGQSALPLQWSGNTVDSAAFQRKLPPLQSVMQLDRLKPGAQVLAEAISGVDERHPLLISQFAGAGRIVLLATDETYRWTGVYGSDTTHQLFWGQTLRWLSRGKLNSQDQSELWAEPKQAGLGIPVRFQLRLATGIQLPESATIQMVNSDGWEQAATLARVVGNPNTYQGTVEQLAAGEYRAVVVSPPMAAPPAVEFSVVAPPGEQANLRVDLDSMQQLAELSRGKSYDEASATRWMEELPAGRATRLGSLPPQPLWNSTWVALLFLTLITAEWLLRRFARML